MVGPRVGVAVAPKAGVDGASDGRIFWGVSPALDVVDGEGVGVVGEEDDVVRSVRDADEGVSVDSGGEVDAEGVMDEGSVDVSEAGVVQVVEEAFNDAATTSKLLGEGKVGVGEDDVVMREGDELVQGDGAVQPNGFSGDRLDAVDERLESPHDVVFFSF
jgi:hypothetical protein